MQSGYAKFFSRSHDAVIRVYDEAMRRTVRVPLPPSGKNGPRH
ncbi:MAG TPA: hypothetical protein VGI41_00780 [Candidatus Udaeobacter sp.]